MWRPRSPSPAAPSTASAMAWATASASLWPARPRTPVTDRSTPPEHQRRSGSSRTGGCRCPDPPAGGAGRVTGCTPASRASARARSSGRVSLRLRGSPATVADGQSGRLEQPGIVGCLAPVAGWAARSASAAKACGVWMATRPSRSTVATTRPPSTRFRVSATGTTGTAPSTSPVRTASTTRRTSSAAASGRAASWTTIDRGVVGHGGQTGTDRVGTGHARPRPRRSAPSAASPCDPGTGTDPSPVVGSAAGHHQDHPVGHRAGGTDRPGGDRVPGQGEELLAAAEPSARAAGDHDGPDGPRSAQGSASLRRTSAVSSSTPRAKVSSDTRIWRARLSMRFSPADSPLSLSRIERFRTTSATW